MLTACPRSLDPFYIVHLGGGVCARSVDPAYEYFFPLPILVVPPDRDEDPVLMGSIDFWPAGSDPETCFNGSGSYLQEFIFNVKKHLC